LAVTDGQTPPHVEGSAFRVHWEGSDERSEVPCFPIKVGSCIVTLVGTLGKDRRYWVSDDHCTGVLATGRPWRDVVTLNIRHLFVRVPRMLLIFRNLIRVQSAVGRTRETLSRPCGSSSSVELGSLIRDRIVRRVASLLVDEVRS
jgi:hypothetical protein